MVSDSIIVQSSSALPNKDFGKKKRANRSAKLKQCKLDAKREQWLSQGVTKNKEEKKLDEIQLGQKFCGFHKSDREKQSKEDDNESSSSLSSSLGIVSNGGTDCETSFLGSSSSFGSVTEEEDDCLDDWEAVADALAAADDRPPQGARCDENRRQYPTTAPASTRAWRADDAFRPQSLPSLSKLSKEGIFGNGRGTKTAPSCCPICYEELDCTDSRFLPCLCGFKLCLFCHKRILEEDGRCPGCRKPYEHLSVEGFGYAPARGCARSFSMKYR